MRSRLGPALGALVIAASCLASCRPNQEAAGGEAGVRQAVRGYVSALDTHSGRRVCDAMAPDALAKLALPKRRGSCAASIAASIGYRDPRGYPVWRRTDLVRFRSIDLDEGTASATVRVRTIFANGREPSIEDDVVHLAQRDGRWLIAKPSATLYRAIGVGTPPLSALRAP